MHPAPTRPAAVLIALVGLSGPSLAQGADGPVFGVRSLRTSHPPIVDVAWYPDPVHAPTGPGGPDLFFFAYDGETVGACVLGPDGMTSPVLGQGPGVPPPLPLFRENVALSGDGPDGPSLYFLDGTTGAAHVVNFDGETFAPPAALGTVGRWVDALRHFPDLDGDGIGEVIARTGPATLAVRWSSRASSQVESIELGHVFIEACVDLTGDARPDLLLRRTDGQSFLLLAGTASDALAEPITIPIPDARPTAGVFDLTGDGLADIVLGGAADMVVLERHIGSFTERTIAVPDGVATLHPVGDFDADGSPDVLLETTNYPQTDARLRWLWRNPLEGYDRSANPLVDRHNPHTLARDMNADGLPDLVSISQHAVHVDYQSSGAPHAVGATVTDVRRASHVLAADLDFDGVPELIVVGQRPGVDIHRRQPDGTYTREQRPGSVGHMSAAADINADGLLDVVVATNERAVAFHPGLPGGTIGAPVNYVQPPGARVTRIVTGDLNGDAVPDFVAVDRTGSLLVFYGVAGGDPLHAATVSVGIPIAGLAVMDADKDGRNEIIVGATTEERMLVLKEQDGAWSVQHSFPSPIRATWMVVADIDADGHDDLLASGAGTLSRHGVFFGGPDGLASEPVWLWSDHFYPTIELAVADLTGNGLLDVVYTPQAPASATVVRQTAPRQFAQRSDVLPVRHGVGLVLTDLDADGDTDAAIVTNMSSAGFLAILEAVGAPCPADFDASGLVDVFDLLGFVDAYLAGDPGADLAAPFGTVDFFDLLAFLDAYAVGCP